MAKSGRYRIALLGGVLVVFLNVWLATHALGTLFNAQSWQSHTLEVISKTEAVIAEVRTAESAARGYILTGSPTFEKLYTDSEARISAKINQIQQLTGDNPVQQQRITLLRSRVNDKIAALELGMAVRTSQPDGAIPPSMLQSVENDTPDRADSVQSTINDIEQEEQALLAKRTSTTVSARRQVFWSFIAASVLDIVLLVAAYQLLMRAYEDAAKLAEKAVEVDTLNNDLTTLNAELEERVQQRTRELAVSNQELEAFSYSVSHDLRAPLRTIDGFSLALMEDFADKLNDEGRDYIARVRNGVQRMGTLIDALLQLSRVTRTEVQRERLDLSQLATLVFNELRASDQERDVLLVAQPGVLVEADPRLVRIALENLIGNALKFTSKAPDARIEFGSSSKNGHPVYFIRDNGAGFDMQYVDRLFTAFQRLHGDRDYKGSGIGLATVSRIIRRHHGTIWAESDLGRGATFYFTLQA